MSDDPPTMDDLGLSAPVAGAGPSVNWYRLVFESGMVEYGTSCLGPVEFDAAIREAANAKERVAWNDVIDRRNGIEEVTTGGSFKAWKVDSHRWIENPPAGVDL